MSYIIIISITNISFAIDYIDQNYLIVHKNNICNTNSRNIY